MKLKIFVIFILLVFVSCNNKNEKEKNSHIDNFTYRIHTTDLETDYYKLKGKTTKENFIKEFKNIEWIKEYQKFSNNEEFNFPDIEIMDNLNGKYLSISIAPNTLETSQFVIGIGNHKIFENKIERTVKLYWTETDDQIKITELISLFFNRETDSLKKRIDNLDFDEIEDLYLNVK